MEKESRTSWTIRMIGVSFIDGNRQEKPFSEFTEVERQEMSARKNLEALKAAGYVPVSGSVTGKCRNCC